MKNVSVGVVPEVSLTNSFFSILVYTYFIDIHKVLSKLNSM